MKTRTRLGLVTLGILTLVAAAPQVAQADALFDPQGGIHAWKGRRGVLRKLDAALAAAQVTPAQRARIQAARDRMAAAMKGQFQARQEQRKLMREIFAADQLDEQRLQTLRAQQEALARRVGDATVLALREIHATLTPDQRRIVAQELAKRGRGGRWGRWGRGMPAEQP